MTNISVPSVAEDPQTAWCWHHYASLLEPTVLITSIYGWILLKVVTRNYETTRPWSVSTLDPSTYRTLACLFYDPDSRLPYLEEETYISRLKVSQTSAHRCVCVCVSRSFPISTTDRSWILPKVEKIGRYPELNLTLAEDSSRLNSLQLNVIYNKITDLFLFLFLYGTSTHTASEAKAHNNVLLSSLLFSMTSFNATAVCVCILHYGK